VLSRCESWVSLSLGLSKILVLGPGSHRLRNRVPEAWTILSVKTSHEVLHSSVSSRKAVSRGCPPHSSSYWVSPWGLDLPKFPQILLWDAFWPTSSLYGCHLISKPKNSFFFLIRLGHNTNWTMTLDGTFNPNILRKLYTFCEHTGK
jgi:hypothetical protein